MNIYTFLRQNDEECDQTCVVITNKITLADANLAVQKLGLSHILKLTEDSLRLIEQGYGLGYRKAFLRLTVTVVDHLVIDGVAHPSLESVRKANLLKFAANSLTNLQLDKVPE